MRTRLLLLLALLVFQLSFSYHNVAIEPVVPNLPNLSVCDNNNDGFAVFDLTVQNTYILAAQSDSASDYNIVYYQSYTDATLGGASINNPSSYSNISPNGDTVFYKITHIPSGDYAVGSFSLIVNPIPVASGPQSFMSCDVYGDPYDGIGILNLTQFNTAILNSQNPNQYSLTYYINQSNANTGVSPIVNASNYSVTNGQIIWARVENNTTGCFSLTTINVMIISSPNPIITSNNGGNIICVDYYSGTVVQPLILNSGVANPSAYTFNWYENGALIAGANNNAYFVNTPDFSGATRNYSVRVTSNSPLGCNTTATPFSVLQSSQAAIVPSVPTGYTIINLSGVQSIVVSVNGYGTYEYSLDDGPRQVSNVFENVSLGDHTINVWDTEGGLNYSCDPLIITNVAIVESEIPAPTGLTSQSFSQGATLADVVVTGTDVQWYASATSRNATAIPLPLSTELVNGTTYYATQTINGIESVARLAVTVQITLETNQNDFLPIQFAPNPVKNSLTLQSNKVLKSVLIYTMLGQKVFEQSYENTNVTIDLSGLNTGNYILKAEGETGQKTIRIVKE